MTTILMATVILYFYEKNQRTLPAYYMLHITNTRTRCTMLFSLLETKSFTVLCTRIKRAATLTLRVAPRCDGFLDG